MISRQGLDLWWTELNRGRVVCVLTRHYKTTHHKANTWDERHPIKFLSLSQYQLGVWSACRHWLVAQPGPPQAIPAGHSQSTANFVHVTVIPGTQTLTRVTVMTVTQKTQALGHPSGRSRTSSLRLQSSALTRDLHNRSTRQRPVPRLPGWLSLGVTLCSEHNTKANNKSDNLIFNKHRKYKKLTKKLITFQIIICGLIKKHMITTPSPDSLSLSRLSTILTLLFSLHTEHDPAATSFMTAKVTKRNGKRHHIIWHSHKTANHPGSLMLPTTKVYHDPKPTITTHSNIPSQSSYIHYTWENFK